ncbi:hypothetical protein CDN99_05235 [Roseateles aquatilis]|uniref:TIGR02646 family protein n=1 Tax=Roseateles aquatilis TaxID=431061 RepID=A0A246JNV2_9BURK|nr:hypothetical protein [Roseateles aquatilis]OWQ93839.1 hypothetical protein CDN99_05235 [Roseateles aquatilis]
MPGTCRTAPNGDADWEDWLRRCAAALKDLVTNRSQGVKTDIRGDVYKGAIPFLMTLTHNRCAYCEAKIYQSPPELEHYRPKGRIANAGIKADGEEHPGYWWLAYEWANMLPSCIDCNRVRKHGADKELAGKGDNFPLKDEGRRAWSPDDPIDAEEPLLLDPLRPGFAWDEHFAFNFDGTIQAKSEHGAETIRILGLNRRELLLEQRRQRIDDAVERMSTYLQSRITRAPFAQAKLRALEEMWEGDSDFGSFTQRALHAYVDELATEGVQVRFPPEP